MHHLTSTRENKLLQLISRIGISFIVLSCSSASNAACWDGIVSKVIDGDTLVATDTNQAPHTIRLAAIDAPEIAQPYGEEARSYLDEISYHQAVRVCVHKMDTYHREIATATSIKSKFSASFNLMLINRGYAWHYKHYANEQPSSERSEYANAEMMARDKGLGLWAQQDPMAPWQYRKANKKD